MHTHTDQAKLVSIEFVTTLGNCRASAAGLCRSLQPRHLGGHGCVTPKYPRCLKEKNVCRFPIRPVAVCAVVALCMHCGILSTRSWLASFTRLGAIFFALQLWGYPSFCASDSINLMPTVMTICTCRLHASAGKATRTRRDADRQHDQVRQLLVASRSRRMVCGPAILCGSRHPHAWFVACPGANCAQSTCLMLLA
jgi:hypothetical protein